MNLVSDVIDVMDFVSIPYALRFFVSRMGKSNVDQKEFYSINVIETTKTTTITPTS